jgi:hypothetical protein
MLPETEKTLSHGKKICNRELRFFFEKSSTPLKIKRAG